MLQELLSGEVCLLVLYRITLMGNWDFSVQACQSSRFTESLLDGLPFNDRDRVFANGHQIATSEQFRGSRVVMPTEYQIDLLTAVAIMQSHCHWHILQGVGGMVWVTLSVCHPLLCPVWRHLKTAKAAWKMTFPRGVEKKKTASFHICFSYKKNTAAWTCHCRVLSLSPFSPWQVSFESVPLSYISLQHSWQRKRKQPRIHDLLISDVFCLILVNIYSRIVMCKTLIILVLALWAGIMGAHRSKDKGFCNHLGNNLSGVT